MKGRGFNPASPPRPYDTGYFIEMYDGAGRESYLPAWHPSRQMLDQVDLIAEIAEVDRWMTELDQKDRYRDIGVHQGNPWRWRYQ